MPNLLENNRTKELYCTSKNKENIKNFRVGDLVLVKVQQNTTESMQLLPKYKGPYCKVGGLIKEYCQVKG